MRPALALHAAISSGSPLCQLTAGRGAFTGLASEPARPESDFSEVLLNGIHQPRWTRSRTECASGPAASRRSRSLDEAAEDDVGPSPLQLRPRSFSAVADRERAGVVLRAAVVVAHGRRDVGSAGRRHERRTDLVRTRTTTVNRLHQLFVGLLPAGVERISGRWVWLH